MASDFLANSLQMCSPQSSPLLISSSEIRYSSLRMEGRVRVSGVGYPPWNAFFAQLPPVKGIWSGLLIPKAEISRPKGLPVAKNHGIRLLEYGSVFWMAWIEEFC